MADDFTFGIEEEYFLVDARTKRAVRSMPETFFKAAEAATDGRISREFLQAQIEVITSPHARMADARAELRHLRQAIAAVAASHGLAILACGTHPTAEWGAAEQTAERRYDAVMADLQMIGRRDMFCGMHVHVALPDPDARIDVMRRMLPYVPLLLALSTSSPFWQSCQTGLMGYRLAGHDEQPRSGLPDLFRTTAEFDAYVTALVRAGVIADSSFLWWAIRPSLRNPTLELRCTLVEDSLAIAALYRTIVRHLFVQPRRNAAFGAVGRAIALENKWRAQRYGVRGTFIADTFIADEGAVPVADCLKRVIAETARDAEALGCTDDVGRCVAIAAEGTAADAQVAIFEAHKESASHEDALRAVLDWIAAATLQ
jgi:glutamate---cysteine ligase / carboxylate-amine ligase